MTEKKAFYSLAGYLAGALVLVALAVFLVDPFYHYHDAWFGMPVVLENAVYQTPGAARNLEYDSVIVGTSMTENFHASWFDEAMGWKTLKLSYSGARTDDLKAILGQIYTNREAPENILMDVNAYQLTVDPKTAYAIRPEYLYDDKIVTDTSYLYNQDVLLASVNRVLDGLHGRESNLDEAYTWEDEVYFGKDQALETERKTRGGMAYEPISLEVCDQNIDNILPFIEAHPETTFYIFYPPYSMLYWEREMIGGSWEEMLFLYKHSIERFLEYENVKVYYFQDEKEIISNLDNYRDATHHRPEYNKYICECIAAGKNLLTKENYEDRILGMYEYVQKFDYEVLWK